MSKLNQILIEWVPGDVHSLSWLEKRHVSSSLAQAYHKNGALSRISSGIYKRAGEQADWIGAIRLLQEEQNKSFHVSGRTALELVGSGHYGNLGKRPLVFLTTYTKNKLPIWLTKADFGCEFVSRKSSMFPNDFFTEKNKLLLATYTSPTGIKIKISCRELAILEFIDNIDLKNSLETAENYVEMLHGIRVNIMQSLLEQCGSIKVKRVFLYVAEKINSRYFGKLNLEKINLGKGKRQVVKYNAKLDKKYQITVDKGYNDYDGELL